MTAPHSHLTDSYSVAPAELVLGRLSPLHPPGTFDCQPSTLDYLSSIDTFCHHFSIDFRRLLDYTACGVISMEYSRPIREPQGRISPNSFRMRRCANRVAISFGMRRCKTQDFKSL
jgi:hypothetical protein